MLAASAEGARPPAGTIAFLDRGRLTVVDLSTGSKRILATRVSAAPGLSGDGKLVSVGGRILGGPTLTRSPLVWAPRGETAAFQTRAGTVFTWTPTRGRRLVVGAAWGATSFAWGPTGALALGRSVCRVPCGIPIHQEVWIWRYGSLRRAAGPLRGEQRPLAAAVGGDGRALWWRDPFSSASIAADGIPLYANRTLVAAASQNTTPPRIGREHRAIWQLLPTRRRLTRPPMGASDEFPRLLRDGSVVFLRTRSRSTRTALWGVGTVELLRNGRLTRLGTAGRAANYYGHYDWPRAVAIAP